VDRLENFEGEPGSPSSSQAGSETGAGFATARNVGSQDLTPVTDIIDLEGNMVEGSNRPSSEMPMHLIFYKHLEGVQAIVHTHSPFATALSVVRRSIPVICSASLSLGGEVPVANFALPGTREIGHAALTAIRKGGEGCIVAESWSASNWEKLA